MFTAVVVLPTPPFWLTTARTLPISPRPQLAPRLARGRPPRARRAFHARAESIAPLPVPWVGERGTPRDDARLPRVLPASATGTRGRSGRRKAPARCRAL